MIVVDFRPMTLALLGRRGGWDGRVKRVRSGGWGFGVRGPGLVS